MIKIVFLLLLLSSNISSVFAEEILAYERTTHLEWDPVEDAERYEFEFVGDKTTKKIVSETSLDIALKPGKYKVRSRSIDNRGVPSPWSEPKEFEVKLETVNLSLPKNEEKIRSNENEKDKVLLSWKTVPGASKYKLIIFNSNKEIFAEEITSSTQFEAELPVAQYYKWQVTALTDSGTQSEDTPSRTFELVGKKLTAPNINELESRFVRELSWSEPDRAQTYSYKLFKLDKNTKKYNLVKKEINITANKIPFSGKWPGGMYRLNVRAEATGIAPSEESKLTFDVIDGDRSPAAEYAATIRQSIERTQGWYGIASYFITMIKYYNSNAEQGAPIAIEDGAIGGTGRLGLGWFSEKMPWGFLGVIDASGFSSLDKSNQYKTHNYGSVELSAVYRKNFLVEDDLRLQLGLYNRSLVALTGDVSNPAVGSIGASGIHLGAEYWYSLSAKLGLQGHTHFYLNTNASENGSSRTSNNALSYQYGLLGSYRMSPKWTGLAGVTVREDKVSYKTTSGKNNETSISGTYLNFFAEYDF